MISIIDIDHQHSLELADSLKEITEDFKITFDESELLKSSKIIISFSDNISKAIRKIHLMNLFSALRMTSDKPILGIDSGMHLMCENADGISCLGMIPGITVKSVTLDENEFDDKKLEIIKISNDFLLKDIDDGAKFYFEKNYFLSKNIFSTSVLKKKEELSASIRKDNFFGLQFLPQKSGEDGLKILKNFVEL